MTVVPDVAGPSMRSVAPESPRNASERARRVLHALAPGEYGGLESVVAGLATAQREAGLEVEVVLVTPGPHDAAGLEHRLGAAGVTTHRVVAASRDLRAEYRAITAICAARRPDLVHTHGYRADLVDGLAARRAGIPVVSTVHGFTGGGWKMRAYEWLQSRALRRFDSVVAVSAPLRQRLLAAGVPDRVLDVIRNAYAPDEAPVPRAEARRALGVPADRFVAGWVGRLSHEKGPDVFIEALAGTNAGVHAAFVGDGPLRTSLGEQSSALGLVDRVTWSGTVPSAGRLLRAFDVLVVSSRTEGTPMVVLEAMAAGVPVLATRVGGVPDMLAESESWLVAPERPAELAAALEAVAADPGGRDARAARARDRLRRDFGVGAWVRRYDAAYERVAPMAGHTTPSDSSGR